MRTFELRRGPKTIYGIEKTPGCVTVLVDCHVYNMVEFTITTDEAERVFDPNRRQHIQDILPGTHKSLREIFISGTTPAEFDMMHTAVKGQACYPQGCYANTEAYE